MGEITFHSTQAQVYRFGSAKIVFDVKVVSDTAMPDGSNEQYWRCRVFNPDDPPYQFIYTKEEGGRFVEMGEFMNYIYRMYAVPNGLADLFEQAVPGIARQGGE